MAKREDPRTNIMHRYDQRTMAQNTEQCHYDNLREHGFPRDAARRIARKAADVTQKSLDGQQDALAHGDRGIRAAKGADAPAGKPTPPATPWLRWADE